MDGHNSLIVKIASSSTSVYSTFDTFVPQLIRGELQPRCYVTLSITLTDEIREICELFSVSYVGDTVPIVPLLNNIICQVLSLGKGGTWLFTI